MKRAKTATPLKTEGRYSLSSPALGTNDQTQVFATTVKVYRALARSLDEENLKQQARTKQTQAPTLIADTILRFETGILTYSFNEIPVGVDSGSSLCRRVLKSPLPRPDFRLKPERHQPAQQSSPFPWPQHASTRRRPHVSGLFPRPGPLSKIENLAHLFGYGQPRCECYQEKSTR